MFQSDIEVSASEAEERGFSSGTVSLDRVTKEQLYAAYRRTQERYTKYRTQYGDLARHYKLLERENAKARVRRINYIGFHYHDHHHRPSVVHRLPFMRMDFLT